MSCSTSAEDCAHPTAVGHRGTRQLIATLNRCTPSHSADRIVSNETDWRRPPAAVSSRITAMRWASPEIGVREVAAQTPDNAYIVGLVLRPTDVRLSVAGNVVHDGIAAPGMMHVTEPCAPAQGLFRGPYETLHLHVPLALLNECDGHHRVGLPAILRSQPTSDRDTIAARLGLALLKAEELDAGYGQIYAEGLSMAIVTRLLALQNLGRAETTRANPQALSKWRLRRVVDYVEAHLGESISLADVATAAGLSRMHFAAQFKAATGCRPHDYVMLRRVARAQQMMAGSGVPLVDIALEVGFQNQAHFTTVFKRFISQTPDAWRRSHRKSA